MRSATFEWEASTEFSSGPPDREALHGREPGTLGTREAVLDVLHPDDRELVRRTFARADTGRHGEVLECEYRTVWPNGTVRWLRSVGRVEHRDERQRRFSGVVLDITDRKFALERLAASEARHREIADSYARAVAAAHIAPYEWDIKTGARTGSPAREALYGRPAGSLSDDQSTLAAVHPDDRGIVRAFQQRMKRANDGETVSIEYRAVWPDGQVRWLRNICRISAAGGVRRVSGVLSDITESKRDTAQLTLSERRYRILAEHLGTTLWQANASGAIMHAYGWTTLTGQQEGEYQRFGWEEAVHPEDRPRPWQRGATLRTPRNRRCRVQGPQHQHRGVDLGPSTGSPDTRRSGQPHRMVGRVREHRRAEAV